MARSMPIPIARRACPKRAENQRPSIGEGGIMIDVIYVIGLIGFFVLCALYVAALERI